MVLLKNKDNLLPIDPAAEISILLTGDFADELYLGHEYAAATVKGFDHVYMLPALQEVFGSKVYYKESPTSSDIEKADYVIYSTGTQDSEGWDRSFDLPQSTITKIQEFASLNPNIIVVISSGSGVNMSPWNDQVAGILYSWYPGQIGFKAMAEIIGGITNPSGKLPITIEKSFKDSPGYPYIPDGEELYSGWDMDMNILQPIYDVNYDEGVFVGYRWYEYRNIEPLYPFGHGLSYTTFSYSNLVTETNVIKSDEMLNLKVDVKNTGEREGMEIVQVYVKDTIASVERPIKELKDFQKISLAPGEQRTINFTLNQRDFAFWDVDTNSWMVEPGEFEILIGSASNNILASTQITIEK
jgi:beta-glucosidase